MQTLSINLPMDESAFFNLHSHPENAAGGKTIVNYIVGKDSAIPRDSLISCGIHPWYIQDKNTQFAELDALLSGEKNVAAIGEAGLDKLSAAPYPLQQEIFRGQALRAEKWQKPLIIHAVKTWGDLLAEHKRLRPLMPWIIHGFRGKGELAGQLLREGFYLSFGLHFHPEALREAWPGRLFLETDEAPVSIGDIYQNAAQILGISPEELAKQVEKNARACQFRFPLD